MSHLSTSKSRLSPDDRYELATIAQNQQRLNYPRHLIVIGILLVFISIVVLAIAWQVRSEAQSTNTKTANGLIQIDDLINQIRTLEQAQISDPQQDIYKPISDMRSRLSRFAAQANLEYELGLPKNSTSRPEGTARRMTYPYTVRDPSLEHLLDWIKISTEQIPGLQVTDLTIKPANQDWTMSVTLARYERIE
jgi:hypothetical protein